MSDETSSTEARRSGLPHSVLIVEDQIHTAENLRNAVDACDDLQVCGVAYDLETAWAMFEAHKPRFVLTDLELPDGSGVEIIRAATDAIWTCDSMAISVFGDRQRSMDAIRAGAKGYILKSGSVADAGQQILSVIDGGSPMSPKIARYLLTLLVPADAESPDTDLSQLTEREQQILSLVARGYKRREIAELLDISVGTVGIHINNTYRKLEVSSNMEAVARASRIGLI
ncbi:response regulator transcription factor [Roseibium algae]|uniref:Response regulator transcription factor n=1 Tax=Roseibium algae TaxID=3123038 RepID=A0ABU8TRX5_9HYPH